MTALRARGAAIACALACGAVHAAPPGQYALVQADGSPCCAAGTAARAYLLDVAAPAPARPVRATAIDRLVKEHFEVEVDNDAVLAGPRGDLVVLTLSRPAGYDRKYVPCAAGMGESRAWLVTVAANGVDVIGRDLGGCGREYRVIRDGADVGYIVADTGTQAHPVRYRLRADGTVRRD